MRTINPTHTAFYLSVFALLALVMSGQACADVTPDFLTQERDAESSIGGILREVFNWILYLAVGLGAIGAAMGLAETSGVFGQKEKGIEKIKVGLAVVAVGGVFLGLVAFFAGLGT